LTDELLCFVLELLLGVELDEGSSLGLLELGVCELLLGGALELLLGVEPDEGTTAGLLELGGAEELLGFGLAVFITLNAFLLSP